MVSLHPTLWWSLFVEDMHKITSKKQTVDPAALSCGTVVDSDVSVYPIHIYSEE